MSIEALRHKLERSERNGTLPKIVVPVHYAGQSCDMRAIRALADQYGFRIIEDASHAIGGRYLQRPVGDCSYSDLTVFSFHPVKIITTAEGGMVLTNSAALADKVRLLRSHGITRDPSTMDGESHGAWFYQQLELGFNYRMTDIQAALGVSQMTRLDAFVRRRHEIARRYDGELRPLPVITPYQREDAYSAYHLYPIRLPRAGNPAVRRDVFDRLRRAGILVNVHYIPVHLQPYYRRLGFREGDYPQAESYYRSALSLPMFAALSDRQQGTVLESVRDALQCA